MITKILNIIFIAGLLLNSVIALSQSQTTTYNLISNPLINIKTGKSITREEYVRLYKQNPEISFIPRIDKNGEVDHFEIDPDHKGEINTIDTLRRANPAEPLPPFVMRSINGTKFASDKMTGKIIMLYFVGFFNPLFFKKEEFSKFQNLVVEMQKTKDIVLLLITNDLVEDLKDYSNILPSDIEIIPNGSNFMKRYEVMQFPTVIILDKEQKLIAYLNARKIEKVKALIEKLD